MARVLHASASGYFPSCLQVSNELAIFTLEEAMEIYWKVRSWTISGTYLNDLNESSPFSQTFISTLDDEKYLVCPARNYSPYFETDFSPQTDEAFFQRSSQFYINFSGNLYGLDISFQLLPPDERAKSIGTFPNNPSSEVGSLSILGKSIPFYAEKGDGDEFPRSANGTMTPSLYWTYVG
jgi:hypothetical protein